MNLVDRLPQKCRLVAIVSGRLKAQGASARDRGYVATERKRDKDEGCIVTVRLRELRGVTKMILTSARPGALVSAINCLPGRREGLVVGGGW